MKKLIAIILTLILSLGILAAASAAPFYLETAGVTIEVPDGMTATDQSDGENSILGIAVDGNDALAYVYVVRYIEEIAGKNLQDLSEAEAQELGMGIGAALENPSLSTAEVNGYPVLVVANGDATQLHYIAILNGWMCDVAAVKKDGVALVDEDILGAATLLASITFDEVAEDADQAEEGDAGEGAEEEAAVEEEAE